LTVDKGLPLGQELVNEFVLKAHGSMRKQAASRRERFWGLLQREGAAI